MNSLSDLLTFTKYVKENKKTSFRSGAASLLIYMLILHFYLLDPILFLYKFKQIFV